MLAGGNETNGARLTETFIHNLCAMPRYIFTQRNDDYEPAVYCNI
jgi:hypothetical protein